jgi:hypothetical protein
MSEAESRNEDVRAERTAAEFSKQGDPELTQQLFQSFLQVLVLNLAGAVLCQQLLKDVGSKCVQLLRKAERQRFLAKSIFEPAVSTATSKLGG